MSSNPAVGPDADVVAGAAADTDADVVAGAAADTDADVVVGAAADPNADVVADSGADTDADVVVDQAGDPPADPDEVAIADVGADVGAGTPGTGAFDTRPMCQVSFDRIEVLLPSTHPVMVLQEKDLPNRELRITIGGAEGIAIGYASRGIPTTKPLTHALVARIMELFNLTLDVVRITEVRGTSFSGEIVVSGPAGAHVIECRPSDAIALALRQRMPVPIMVAPEVLAQAGVINA
jgi:bifunctional DNase/RNase